MRYHPLAIAILLAGCQSPRPQQPADQIEIDRSGMTGSLSTYVDKSGVGSVEQSDLVPPYFSRRSFRISEKEFRALEARLAKFREQAAPIRFTAPRVQNNQPCPEDVPWTTDAGSVSIIWKGSGFEEQYLVHLGCDSERYAERNAELRGIIESLPR